MATSPLTPSSGYPPTPEGYSPLGSSTPNFPRRRHYPSSEASTSTSSLGDWTEYLHLDLVPECRLKLQAVVGHLKVSGNWIHKPGWPEPESHYSRPEIVLKPVPGTPLTPWLDRAVYHPHAKSTSLRTGIFNLAGVASCQLTAGYNANHKRPFFGYTVKLLGDLKPSKTNFNVKLRHSPRVSRGRVVIKSGAKMDWDVPVIRGAMDEEGHVDSDQDWGSLSFQIPHADVKIKLNRGAVKDKDIPRADGEDGEVSADIRTELS